MTQCQCDYAAAAPLGILLFCWLTRGNAPDLSITGCSAEPCDQSGRWYPLDPKWHQVLQNLTLESVTKKLAFQVLRNFSRFGWKPSELHLSGTQEVSATQNSGALRCAWERSTGFQNSAESVDL